MNQNVYKFLFFLLIILSCKKIKPSKNLSQTSEVVLIFKNAPQKQKIQAPSGVGFTVFYKKIVSYFDGYADQIISPKRGINVIDTIKISNIQKFIELNIEDGKYDFYKIFVEKGDTIHLNYENKIPRIYHKSKNYDINYDKYFEEKFNKKYSEKIKFLHPLPFILFKNPKSDSSPEERYDSIKKISGKLMIKNLNKESIILDSLFHKKRIPSYLYQYRKEVLKIYTWHYEIENSLLSNKKIDSLLLSSDSKLHIQLYRQLLHKLISVRYKLKSIRGNNKYFGKDSRQAFDSILISNSIGNKTKDYLLFEQLKLINSDFPLNEFNSYFKLFKTGVKNKKFVELIEEKYLINFDQLKKETKEVVLIDTNKSKFDLEQIIKNNNGKLIYVDFWASWCAPCIAEIPKSNELRKELVDKDIVFLYVSIDKDVSKWKKAVIREKIYKKNSYLAVNYPNAKFYKELNLKSIPRYLLYDKKGKLIHKNAPSPNSKELRFLLNRYIEK